MKSKKGISVWVSAVLYFGIGLTIIGIILSAGMPVVDRVRDKNIATQTKSVLFDLDKAIKDVTKEGGGAQRIMTLDLKKGNLYFDITNYVIEWNYTTTAVLSEPNSSVKEGPLMILTTPTQASGEYILNYKLNYSCALAVNTSLEMISGTRELVISNTGQALDVNGCGNKKSIPVVEIKEV